MKTKRINDFSRGEVDIDIDQIDWLANAGNGTNVTMKSGEVFTIKGRDMFAVADDLGIALGPVDKLQIARPA